MILHTNALTTHTYTHPSTNTNHQKVEKSFQHKVQALARKNVTLYFIKIEIKFPFYKRLIQMRL